MKDPTRIPAVLEELRATWEGQPDLSLATLFGILQNSGVGWGTEDPELVTALQQMRHRQPARIGPQLSSRFLVNTSGPDNRITIDPFRVVLRRLLPRGAHTQPGVWEYSSIQRCEVGVPLLITDATGIDHRLGVVESIELVDDNPQAQEPGLPELKRADIDALVLLIQLEGERTVVLDRSLNVFSPQGRELHHEMIRWEVLSAIQVGQPLVSTVAGQKGSRTLGVVQNYFRLEA